jgi:hypothetical protein
VDDLVDVALVEPALLAAEGGFDLGLHLPSVPRAVFEQREDHVLEGHLPTIPKH